MATIRLVPSTYAVSNANYVTVSNTANMFANTDSTTYGTFTHNRASTSNTYYAYLRGFNFSDIPSNAVISDFTIKLKASATGHTTSTSSSYYMSLVNGTTQIGSTSASGRLSTSVTTFTFAKGSLTWGTIVGYGNNFGIRIPLRRASSNTADVVSVYGAEIEVTYTIPTPRTITTTLSGDGSIDPEGQTTAYDGDEFELTIVPTDLDDEVTAARDGVDITDQLVGHGAESLLSTVPDSYTTHSIQSGSSYAEYAVGNSAEEPSSSGTSSNMYASSGSTGYAEYSFDFSDIPSDAVIEDIEVRCYGHRENNTIDSSHVSKCVLYLGNSAISEDVDFPSTSNSIITLTPDDMPTRSELDNVTVRHFVGYYGGLVLGISFDVTYSTGTGITHYTYTFTVDSDTTIAVVIGGSGPTAALYFKENGAYVKAIKAWKKVNGVYVEQSDLTNVFQTGARYIKGS